ncbi:MAG TPA: amidohydrolase family protein, partial [Longimicrobiales bacterium]|nr:amidohydrolase family protein [Longimicrobiales bacterium]
VLLDSLRAAEPDPERRWSIIHLYQPDEPGRSVVEEMAELGIVGAINPANLYYEGESFLRNVGPERMARHTPYRTLREAGVRLACGSDYPNNPPDPWVGIYQMMTRRMQRNDRVYGEDETVPLTAALRCFTVNGAYLTHDEDARGSIAPGMLADLVVLDGDLEAADPEEILGMAERVLLTLVGGEEAYRAPGFEG